jgi:cytochrome b
VKTSRILVWDLPLRVFHWLLAISFAGALLTAESERVRDLHVLLGYTVVGLLGFRILWGFLGTRTRDGARSRMVRRRCCPTSVRCSRAIPFTMSAIIRPGAG